MTINTLRNVVAHHRDLVLAYLRLGDLENAAQHAGFAREYTLMKREVA